MIVLIDTSCWPSAAPDRTGTLTSEQHSLELLPDGWLRFKTKDGQWHRLPPHALKCMTEDPPKTVEVPYLVSKRKR